MGIPKLPFVVLCGALLLCVITLYQLNLSVPARQTYLVELLSSTPATSRRTTVVTKRTLELSTQFKPASDHFITHAAFGSAAAHLKPLIQVLEEPQWHQTEDAKLADVTFVQGLKDFQAARKTNPGALISDGASAISGVVYNPSNVCENCERTYAEVAEAYKGHCENIIRVGNSGDGGKLLCADYIPTPCVVYSLGSNNQYDFEVGMMKQFKCSVFTFDCTITPHGVPSGVEFFPWCLAEYDNFDEKSKRQFYSLATIMRKLGHSTIDLLKMDIEGAEFGVVRSFEQYAPVQISFETHLNVFPFKCKAERWVEYWKKLDSFGFKVFSYEPNIRCDHCCEWSVIRPRLESEKQHK